MIRKVTLLFLAWVGLLVQAQAQFCGFDQKHQQLNASNPAYLQQQQQFDAQLAALMSNPTGLIINNGNGTVAYQIPVVIHVIHTGGSIGSMYNPTDAQLTGMVNYLNQVYAATWPGYPNASNGGTPIPLQFVMAQRTPWCSSTNGIVRVDGSGIPGYTADGVSTDLGVTPGVDEALVKGLSRWPNTEYYNVWVVDKIDGQDGTSGQFTAGYAYFPTAPADIDGTIMLATQAAAGDITLPHEVGHAFNLYHTFEGDNGGGTCPTNANCTTDGDRVCDTDPLKRTMFNCPTGINSCTGNPYGTLVHNFMDYSSCQDRFTAGQATRVMAALTAFKSRSGLISSLAGTPITSSVVAACTPTVNSGTIGGSNSGIWRVKITDATMTYMDLQSEGYSGDTNKYYIDNSCKHIVDLTAGQSYNFSVKTGLNPEKVRIYVDYNNDGTFQASELIYTHDGAQFNETHTFQYTPPTTATQPGLISCIPLRMRVVSDRSTVSSVTACGQLSYGQAEDYSIIIRGGGPTTGAVSVNLTSGSNPSCFNTPLTFTATPGTGLTPTGYLWYVNGATTGITSASYTSALLTNNDLVTVKMYFVGACGNDSTISTAYTVLRQASVPASVSIAVTSGTNPGCPGQTLTFTATPVNGGSAPVYTWKVNGVTVAGVTSGTYSSTFSNNDTVTVEMVSNSGCASPATATSNYIIVQYLYNVQDIVIGLTTGTNPACAGKPLTFTAAVLNGGSNPQYQWLVNGNAVSGATGLTFTTSTLANNDVITAVSTVSDPCILNMHDTSDPYVVTIAPSDTPHVNVVITQGSNPGCLDSLVEFTATVTNHGAAPDLTWLVNGIPVATGNVYSSNSLFSGDVVTFRSAATDSACYTDDTLFSAPVVMVRNSVPAPPIISFIGNMLVSNVANAIWYGPSNTQIPGATGSSYHPTQPGSYWAVTDNGGCYSAPSNVLTVSLLDIATYDMSQVKIYPNPTSGVIVLDWGNNTVNVGIDVYSVTGQGLMHDQLTNGTRKQLNLSHFANGNYFIVIRDENGNIGTMRITLRK
jgi:hypothetical protein